MSTSIFIKSYAGDLKWLHYCLRSIRKFGSGFDEITLVIDESCRNLMGEFDLSGVNLVHVPDWPNGYIQQQAIKLCADQWVSSEFILFVDSDCIFHMPFSPESFLRDGKPVLMKTKYENLGVGEVWKPITEAVVGWPVEFEYMRQLPFMYRRDTLTAFRNVFPGLGGQLEKMVDRSFSEFNAIGAFTDRYEQQNYYIIDTEVWIRSPVIKQYWSWSGLTADERKEIEDILA